MGLIKVFKETVGGVPEDQWRDFLPATVSTRMCMTRGVRAQSKRSQNKGDESIITDGSIITVADGQFMILTDQGKIVGSVVSRVNFSTAARKLALLQ